MTSKVNLEDPETKDLIKRIVVRMGDQSQDEITHVLSELFPEAPAMRLRSVAEDLAHKRINAEDEFKNMLESDEVNKEVFDALSSGEKDPDLVVSRSQYDPTKFELTLQCNRTPFKEFFDECKDITCENCIKNRITNFETDNKFSKNPWKLTIDRQESRRSDLCKNCGQILDPKKDDLNLQNERLLYKCSYCGHSGWNPAK